MLWKEYRSTKSDLSDFYPIEQFELKLHQVLGEPVSTSWNQGINLRFSCHLWIILVSPYPLFMVHQFRKTLSGLLPITRLCLAWPHFLAGVVSLLKGEDYLIHPRHWVELVCNQTLILRGLNSVVSRVGFCWYYSFGGQDKMVTSLIASFLCHVL